MNVRWPAATALLLALSTCLSAADNTPPEGFTALFNGTDFTGWHGVGTEDPKKFQALTADEKAKRIADSLDDLVAHWKVDGSDLVNDGKGLYMTTDKDYGDYELYVSWKLIPHGDSGVYLKGTPQVQIWDYTDPDYVQRLKANLGSGGLWNNAAGNPAKDPIVLADKPIGEWNTFHIIQVGARTTVYLNDKLVIDQGILENYFDKKSPLIAKGPVQLQTHGNEVRWKNIYIKELSSDEANAFLAQRTPDGFTTLFDGKDLSGWQGAVDSYEVVDGAVRCKPGKGGVLYTKDKYGDFVARVEIKLSPGGNNGLAIRYPGQGDCAYTGMCELQVLDNESPKYAKLDPRQYHGSSYGIAPAARGYQRPVGEWNFQEVTVSGSKIKVELNGNIILDTDIGPITEFMANSPHPGKDLTEGYFGFAGHSEPVEFRNVRIKPLVK